MVVASERTEILYLSIFCFTPSFSSEEHVKGPSVSVFLSACRDFPSVYATCITGAVVKQQWKPIIVNIVMVIRIVIVSVATPWPCVRRVLHRFAPTISGFIIQASGGPACIRGASPPTDGARTSLGTAPLDVSWLGPALLRLLFLGLCLWGFLSYA
jgi:hypothetical protein